jgi:TolB protein
MRKMPIRRLIFLLTTLLVPLSNAQAVLTIKITKGIEKALPIAVVPFGSGGALPVDIAAVVADDLERSGRFQPMATADMPSRPQTLSEIQFADWRRLAMDNLVVGKVTPLSSGEYQVEFRLVDVYKGAPLMGYTLASSSNQLRMMAHRIADLIYEKLLGVKGAFSTRIAYVTVGRGDGGKTYMLEIADVDGQNPQTLLTSQQPLMSPVWSPDGRRLAYVSFEGKNSAIYVQDVMSGSRQEVVAGPGINSSPAWSPDGGRLAVTLSRDGNPEIYVYHLAGARLQRVTNDPAIDTEATWSPDGSRLAFTSDRGGGPQIYQTSASGGSARRLTHQGSYNARPRYSPDGRLLTLVHGTGSSYRIAVLDLETERLNVLTDSRLDESPSFAPNSSMIIYATVGGGGTELAAVSVDGRVRQRLGVLRGEVREPAWGPFNQ